ncbi:MAG: hypothetical protein GC192_20715 [Bacteroidetes bacterium]|nr:hypothetical protein [Bacteroidota bacterium]
MREIANRTSLDLKKLAAIEYIWQSGKMRFFDTQNWKVAKFTPEQIRTFFKNINTQKFSFGIFKDSEQ